MRRKLHCHAPAAEVNAIAWTLRRAYHTLDYPGLRFGLVWRQVLRFAPRCRPMPIRFSCPHCRQKLSVSSRKAGTAAECPRCHRSLTIPPPDEELKQDGPPAAARSEESASEPATGSVLVAKAMTVADASAAALDGPEPREITVALHDSPRRPDAAVDHDAQAFGRIELVLDKADARPIPAAPPRSLDMIAVPRYVLYVQAGLIAVVALLAFAIGVLAGSSLLGPPAAPAAAQACVISGNVTYASGPRHLPDAGAVIAVIPQTPNRPDDKAPTLGLRPDDPTPDAGHKGIAVLRELGGGYARADASGQFQVRVPARGRYLVLVVSHERRDRGAGEIPAADLLQLGPFFDDAANLLADRRYQLQVESVRGDRQLSVAFD